jgi:DNA-binding MarR family transcriptional regulator
MSGSTTPSTSNSDPPGHTANVLGALALALTDRAAEAVSATGDLALNDAIALSALHQFLDRQSIDLLRQVLGLTHSGAVRLVDRLAAAGLVTRGPGPDGRTTALALTESGAGLAQAVTEARARVLETALARLDAEDRRTLDRLAGELLRGLIRRPGATRWICRLCDTTACGRDDGRCPLAQEAARRHT